MKHRLALVIAIAVWCGPGGSAQEPGGPSRIEFPVLKELHADGRPEYLAARISVVLPHTEGLEFQPLAPAGGGLVALPRGKKVGGLTRLERQLTWQAFGLVVDQFAASDKNELLGVPLTSPDQEFTILAQATESSAEEQRLRAELLRRSEKADSHSAESMTYIIRSTRNNLKVQALLIGLRPKTMSVEELARQIADSIQWTDQETD